MRLGCTAPALFAMVLSACATPPVDVTPPLYAAAAQAPTQPSTITFLLPGALTTAEIFRPAQGWAGPEHLVVEYRLPGMQGQPVSPGLDVQRSAGWVADYANRYPGARINLLGYSTGAAIALEAAWRISDGKRVTVAAVSSPTPFPGAMLAALRGGVTVAAGAVRIGSLEKQAIWEEYYKTLYLGTGWRKMPEKRAMANRLEDILLGRVVAPGEGKGRAQSGNLLFWTLSPQATGTQARIAFFHGARDPVFPPSGAERLARRFDAALCLLPEDGHLVFQSNSDILMRIGSYFAAEGDSGPCG